MIVTQAAPRVRCGREKHRRDVVTNCQARAHFRVGVAISPGPKHPLKKPVVFWLPQTVCSGCRSALTFQEAMPTKRWLEMRDYIRQRHGFRLRRRLAKLEFQPL